MAEACARNDLVARKISWVLWGVPAAALILGVLAEPFLRMLLWTPALVVAGGACVVNAGRCGRLHCYMTGPLYLVAAVATVLVGVEAIALPWSWIAVALVGGTLLAYAVEWIQGKYVGEIKLPFSS